MGNILNGHFTKENIRMANERMERCMRSSIIREMQTKTTVRNHAHPLGWLWSKTQTSSKYWLGCRDARILRWCWGEHKNSTAIWKASLYDQIISLLDVYSREMNTYIHTNAWTWISTAASPTWNNSNASTLEWINKILYIHTMDYYPVIKRDEIVLHSIARMNTENGTLRKRSQIQNFVCSHLYPTSRRGKWV